MTQVARPKADVDVPVPNALPRWDLHDLYSTPDDPRIEQDLQWARGAAEEFRAAYAGLLSGIDGQRLAQALTTYEAITERLHRVMSYAQLWFAADMGDPQRGRFLQTVQERFTAISSETLFFSLELNRVDDTILEAQLAEPAAGRYAPWIRDLRVFRPHQLVDDLEQLLHEKSVTGANAWVRLFDQTLAGMRMPLEDRNLTLADVLNLFDHPDGEVRRAAAKTLGRGLEERVSLFALIVNTLAKDKEIEDRWRRFPHPVAARNLSNRLEDEVVEALVGVIQGAYAELAHRYYGLKSRWFGRDRLDYWDRNAPLPGDEPKALSWSDARAIVTHAYRRFHPQLADIADGFFANGWIDAGPRPGKDSGAFCHPVVPSVHPYILMNYYGRARDVMTLAHELGHGVHQVLAADQGALMAETPLTLAESASVFGEMLVFRALLDEQDTAEGRRRLLAGKVESMLNTVVRQIAFHEFEKRVHEQRRTGELSIEALGETWMAVQQESLGPALRFDDEYRFYWAYIPHFVHSPFYVYAYAFGDCLVNSLYQVYLEGLPSFAEKYIEMLRAGGTLRHRDLLQPFGLDASDPAFWRRGINVIVGLIDELEAET
jgi:oligoendopeptidase F